MLSDIAIFEQTANVTDETYDDNATGAFAQGVSLEHGQKMNIRLSANYPNVTIKIKILTQGQYQKIIADNSTSDTVIGQRFIYSRPAYGVTPDATDVPSSTTVGYDDKLTIFIEFMGSSNGADELISVPGNYTVFIYGENDGVAADRTVKFDIKITKTDPAGEVMSTTYNTIGWILVISFAGILAILNLRKILGGDI